MDETAEKYFERLIKQADDLYANGEWLKAATIANMAVEAAKLTNSDEYSAEAHNRKGWSERYVGFKSKNPEEKNAMYEEARKDWRAVLEKSKNLKTKISAIKGLILLPDEDVEQLCIAGIEELINSDLPEQEKENLKAELKNSRGIEIRKTDPKKAVDIFLEAYQTVQRGTVVAGHLMQNAGTCWLILKDKAEDYYWKCLYSERAILHLEKARGEYPADQTEHRRSTQNKIDKTKEEIKRLRNK